MFVPQVFLLSLSLFLLLLGFPLHLVTLFLVLPQLLGIPLWFLNYFFVFSNCFLVYECSVDISSRLEMTFLSHVQSTNEHIKGFHFYHTVFDLWHFFLILFFFFFKNFSLFAYITHLFLHVVYFSL